MEERKHNVDLAKMNEIFNNKTFIYRINGFAYACKMEDIKLPSNSGEIFDRNTGVLFNTKKNRESGEERNYFITVNKNNNPLGKSVTLSGQYNDLNFIFTNYYNKEKLDKKIIDLPFLISLEKKVDKDTYKFNIETVDKMQTKFIITKYREFKNRTLYDDVIFYANVLDFSEILKLVKSFVYNPMLVFNTYNEIDKSYKRVYTRHDLDTAIMKDDNLDKPMGKIKKMVKRITNND